MLDLIDCHREDLISAASVPSATYRLQFHAGFTFEDARRLIPYLSALGVSHIYASPYQQARSGSPHGYDVANPNALNPDLGTVHEYRMLAETLATHNMGQVLDVVPNHMGIGDPGNRWWLDVLENGRESIYAEFFDIDWNRLQHDPADAGKVVMPVLGDQYGEILEAAELQLEFADGEFRFRYHDSVFPLAPQSWRRLLAEVRDEINNKGGPRGASDLLHLTHIVSALARLAPLSSDDLQGRWARHSDQAELKTELARLAEKSLRVRSAIQTVVAGYVGKAGDSRSFDRLDGLIREQNYRLAYWRVAAEEVNYRRFFDINDLVALRMEDPACFRGHTRPLARAPGQCRRVGATHGSCGRVEGSCRPLLALATNLLLGNECRAAAGGDRRGHRPRCAHIGTCELLRP